MPIRAPRICNHCGNLFQPPAQCECSRALKRNRGRRADARRANSHQRGYDRPWQQASARFLRQHPYCAKCGAPSELVDHIVPHKGDTALFWDRDNNWQALCAHCHNSHKQRQERRQRSE
ncbi:HNH endonuclease [Devosia sp.]|uniref:HNH endonuclease n=1 Tax=Devosia sp. TaxID=1871048 RepID=UPI001AD548C1|nr:HNH endonuclease [Devosia sp.]MBN9335374.1 HNH endonuclease [Devosia sp.]